MCAADNCDAPCLVTSRSRTTATRHVLTVLVVTFSSFRDDLRLDIPLMAFKSLQHPQSFRAVKRIDVRRETDLKKPRPALELSTSRRLLN